MLNVLIMSVALGTSYDDGVRQPATIAVAPVRAVAAVVHAKPARRAVAAVVRAKPARRVVGRVLERRPVRRLLGVDCR